MKITFFEKVRTIILFLVCLIIMGIKAISALFIYPYAYLLKDKIYGDDKIEGYRMPSNAKSSGFLWFFGLFLDDHQPKGYSNGYAKNLLGHQPENKGERFYISYRGSAIRNSAYNINYCYLSTRSDIIYHKKSFGKYDGNKKLRTKHGDNGIQFVGFKTKDDHTRFVFSCAIQKINLTFFFGWNPNYNGRITLALRFREDK